MTTVFVLAVLWLIVVVPMVLRRKDARRRERSVAGFGASMRALGRRPARAGADAEVFVPSRSAADSSLAATASPRRRAVPIAQEALMYPVDRSELSEARRQMMKRRRRSLSLLTTGTVLFGLLALVVGGLMAAPALICGLGLVGYLWFLRSQATRDRDRRADRQRRASARRVPHDVDLTERHEYYAEATTTVVDYDDAAESEARVRTVVRIDDDDLELHNLDTIDLTGLYEAEVASQTAHRRAS